MLLSSCDVGLSAHRIFSSFLPCLSFPRAFWNTLSSNTYSSAFLYFYNPSPHFLALTKSHFTKRHHFLQPSHMKIAHSCTSSFVAPGSNACTITDSLPLPTRCFSLLYKKPFLLWVSGNSDQSLPVHSLSCYYGHFDSCSDKHRRT